MEPATKQDLKDLLKEFREEFRRGIREAVAAGFGNSKPALEHASTPAASQLLPTDAPASPTTTVDVVPVLTASSVSAKPLDIDATGGAAPTPTTCSTDGQGHDTDGYGSLAVSQPCRLFTASRDASLTQPCRPFVVLRPDKMAPTRCSTMCFVDETSVFKYMFVAEVTQSIMRQGHVLRPVPWPSFKCHLQLAYLHAVVRKFWFVFLPLAESWYCWQYKHLQQGRPPDRACYWECMVGQGFPRSRILMVIFHPRPSSTYMEKSSPPRFHDSIWYTEDSVNYWECNRSWKLLVGRVPAFTEGRYHNHWSIFAYWGSLEFNHIILHCHRTSIFDPVHQWEFGRRTSIGVATQISGGSAAVQDTMVLMDTLLNWQFLSKEKFERSGSYSRDSIILGDKEVQIVRLLTNIYCCNTTKSEVIQGNLSSSLNIMVTWYLDHGFMRIKKWWLDIHCSQLVNESFEASFWPEQHIIGNYLQVLVTDSLLQLFWSGSTPISLLENILVLTWRSIGLSVEQLSGATYSCTVSLYVASRQWIISWLEGSFGLTTTHSSLQGEQITCSCPKTVTTQLLVSAETECLDSLLLIHAYLGGSCGLKRDINITLLHASKWSSSLHYEKLCNPSSFWSESTMYIDQFKDLFCHMDLLLACMSGQQPIVLLPGHWFVPGMEHLQVLQYTSGFPWYYYLETLKYSCYCLATEDTTGFPASCSDWMSEIKNLVSYGVQEYTVNDFSERHLCGHAASYFVLINFWAMGTGYLQILQQLGNIELKENQISNNIDEQWPGQLVFLCSISDVMAYCFMPDSHSVGLVLPSVICEVVVPPVQYVPRLLCMQPITHKNEATSTLLMGLSAWGVPWDPGDLRIVFEDIPGERNTHFVRQVLLTIPCSSLMDGVEFFTSCGQAPFQGGRNFMILAAFVDHNYYFDAILNLVPASHDEYRDPVRVNSGHGCDYEGYFGNPGEQAYYFGRVYIDLNYYHEDYHGDPSKIKELQAPWDPSKSAFQSPAKFRLGVKPSFKEGGVLATCPPGGPATTRRHQGPAHHQLPVLHGLHIQQGRQRRGHPGMDHEQAPAAASSPTSALLPQPPSCCLIFSTLVLVLASQICHQ